jgi:nucleoside-diphosphate-sugar epimerase
MRYFVTGATGFIGGALARKLVSQGHSVVAIARSPDKAGDLKAAGVEVVKGDITEKDTLPDPMRGADGVYHVAGWYKIGLRDNADGQAINVDGTRNVLEVMRDLNIAKGVYTGTLAINSDTHGKELDESYHFTGKHLSEYDRTKAAAHEVANEFIAGGLPLVIVMPGMVYGPGDAGPSHDTWVGYLQRKLPLVPTTAAYSWGYVDDIVDAHILAMEKGKPGESYIIAGPSATLIEAMDIAEKYTGIAKPGMKASAGMLNAMSAMTGAVGSFVKLPPTYSAEYLRVASASYLGSNAKAKRELGYTPRSLEEGLPPMLDWEMARLGMAKKA